jgi:hypothetical protein
MIGVFNSFLKDKKPSAPRQVERADSGTIIIRGKIKDISKLKKELKSVSVFQNIEESKNGLKAMIVQSTDKRKNPYLYITFEFKQNSLEIYYSIPAEIPNPQMRMLEVMKSVFTMVSLLESRDAYIPDREDLYSKTVEAFDMISRFAQPDMLHLRYELDCLMQQENSLRSELTSLKNEKEGLNHQLVELEKRNEMLEERIKKLESLTDNELDREIVRWVEDHSGKLHEDKFCDSFGIAGSRLEERLDFLSKRGVIRIV